MTADEIEINSNDDEKPNLVEFQKENEILWNNNVSKRNNEKKDPVKENVFESFDGKFAIFCLKKPSVYYGQVFPVNLRK